MINKNTIDDLVTWLRYNVDNANSKGVVFGLSGGIDSAVIAAISKLAFPDTSLGLIMPIHSNPKDEIDAKIVSESLELNTEKIDLSRTYDELIKSSFSGNNLLAKSNIKPRLRMTTLYYYAQELGYLVLGSSNRSEFHIGYFTKWGDTGSDLMPLADFTKTEIFQMASLLKIPQAIIDKKPSAGLWEGQTDEDEMGFTYEVLDSVISKKTANNNFVEAINKKNKNSEHKRNMPLIYENHWREI
ncbi:MAG: NAD(+) synthase [Tissierellia bacterium]|jgi:NAD+ synthase|nr:NAD(+) synthase [Tissierellia bacterium]